MLTLFVLLLVGSLLCLIFELVRQNRTNSVQENDQYTTFLQLQLVDNQVSNPA